MDFGAICVRFALSNRQYLFTSSVMVMWGSGEAYIILPSDDAAKTISDEGPNDFGRGTRDEIHGVPAHLSICFIVVFRRFSLILFLSKEGRLGCEPSLRRFFL